MAGWKEELLLSVWEDDKGLEMDSGDTQQYRYTWYPRTVHQKMVRRVNFVLLYIVGKNSGRETSQGGLL